MAEVSTKTIETPAHHCIDLVAPHIGCEPIESRPAILRSRYLRFRDELMDQSIYSLRPTSANYYERPFDGWGEIIARFGCSFDVEEVDLIRFGGRFSYAA